MVEVLPWRPSTVGGNGGRGRIGRQVFLGKQHPVPFGVRLDVAGQGRAQTRVELGLPVRHQQGTQGQLGAQPGCSLVVTQLTQHFGRWLGTPR